MAGKQHFSLSLYEKQNRTALISVTGVGRKTFRNIFHTRNKLSMSWKDFWVNKDDVWGKSGVNKKTCESILKFKKEYNIYSYWEYLQKRNIWVLDEWDNNYPKLLFETEDRPLVLFGKGGRGVWGIGYGVCGR